MNRAESSIISLVAELEPGSPELAAHSSPDGAVTLLFTDIEESTRLMERLGEQGAYELFRAHGAVVRALVEARGGQVVKSQGDGFMLAFSSAHAGVRCAIDLQRAIADSRSTPAVRVRAGLHSSFVIEDTDSGSADFFGRGVVLAARIADHARGGEILASAVLKEYTEGDSTLRFEARGAPVFKGMTGEHEIHAVLWEDG